MKNQKSFNKNLEVQYNHLHNCKIFSNRLLLTNRVLIFKNKIIKIQTHYKIKFIKNKIHHYFSKTNIIINLVIIKIIIYNHNCNNNLSIKIFMFNNNHYKIILWSKKKINLKIIKNINKM